MPTTRALVSQRSLHIGSNAGVTMSLGFQNHRDGSDGQLLIYAISIAAITLLSKTGRIGFGALRSEVDA